MTKKVRDWIICHDGTARDLAYAMECLRCGLIQKVALPISISGYVAMAQVFEREHAKCRPHAAGGEE